MIRATIQYETELDSERYAQHIAEFVQPIECSAFRHGKVFTPSASPRAATSPSSSGTTWSRSRPPSTRTRSRPRQGRDGDGHPVHGPLRVDRVTEPTHPRPRDPAELGFEAIVYEKTLPRATITLNRPDVLNAFDFRMLRRSPAPARTRPGTTACAPSWSRAPAARSASAPIFAWDEELLGNSSEYWKWFGAFKDMHDRLRDRKADDCAGQRDRCRRRGTSCRWRAISR